MLHLTWPSFAFGSLSLCTALLTAACASDSGERKGDPAPAEDGSGGHGEASAAEHGHGDHAYRPPEGGHAHHRFDDAEAWAKRFEDPERDAWQRPDEVIARLALADDAAVADIGSATGYFPVRLARAVPAGKVFGVDIEPDMVRYLNERASKEGIVNLQSVLGAPDDPKIPEPVDLVLLVDTYHHIEQRQAYFTGLQRYLKPAGRVAVVDFKMGALPVGPPDKMKIPPEQVIEEMAAAGFSIDVDDRELLPHQYVLVFKRAGG